MVRTRFFSFLLLMLAGGLAQAQVPAAQAAVAGVKLDSIVHFVRQLAGERPVTIGGVQDTIRSRYTLHPGNEKAFRFLREKMRSYGLGVDSVMVGARKSLIATLPGISANAYTLGAHYDGVGTPTGPFAAADDNGSGCAAVIEAARILSTLPPLPHTVRFAFWDEEEQGFLGSKDYTLMALNPATHRGYINLDMIAYDGNNDSLIELYTAPRGASRYLADVAQTMPQLYGIGLQIERIDPAPFNTDYVPFWDLNYTAIGLAEDLNGDRNPRYHQAGDSIQLFNLPYFKKLTQLAIALLAHSALTDPVSISSGPAMAGLAVWYASEKAEEASLYIEAPAAGNLEVFLFDAAGRLVQKVASPVHTGRQRLPFGGAGLPPGVYVGRAHYQGTRGETGLRYFRMIR